MAKRQAADTLVGDSPSKRYRRSIRTVDMQLGSTALAGGVSPPSPMALLCSRKRPYYCDGLEERNQEETSLYRKTTYCDTGKQHATVLTEQTSESFLDRRSTGNILTSSKKRPREDCTGSETVIPKANDKHSQADDTKDCMYNSFQYWRVPLPELDFSLLGDTSDYSQWEDKSKVEDSSSDVMET